MATAPTLERLRTRGADAMVVLERDYRAALRDAAGDGYDVVVDPLYGPALEAGLAATAPGARIEEAWERQARGPHHKITLVP